MAHTPTTSPLACRHPWGAGIATVTPPCGPPSAADKAAKKKRGWELIIKLEGGGEIAVEVPGKKKRHEEGDRVRLTTGPGGATGVTKT